MCKWCVGEIAGKKNDLPLNKSLIFQKNLVGWARLELATNGLKVRCSNQLSYQPQARHYDFLLFYCQTQRAPLGKMPVAQHTWPLYHSHMPSCPRPHMS